MNRGHLSKTHLRVLCVVIGLASCSSSDADQVRAQSKIISSCSNSARVALNAWHLNQVPDAYANRTLRAMQDDIGKAASEIETLRNIGTKEREQLTRSVADIVNLLSQAQNRIATRDHDTVQIEQQLRDATERLSPASGMRPSA
jgi:hypothetical protein